MKSKVMLALVTVLKEVGDAPEQEVEDFRVCSSVWPSALPVTEHYITASFNIWFAVSK